MHYIQAEANGCENVWESSRELCIYAYFHDLLQETCEFELMRACVCAKQAFV